MRVFLTGASGFIGSAVVKELKRAGHQVLGLARSDAAAGALQSMGAQVQRGDLADTEVLAAGARACEGVIHAGFIHDFANYAAACETDRLAVEALGTALAGSGRPLVVTAGTGVLGMLHPGRVGTEADASDPAVPRGAAEAATLAWAAQGVRASVLRLPPSVHGDGDKGFVPQLIATAREKRVSAYIGEGQNRWPAVHRLDAACLFRLALEKGDGGTRYHGVADEGVPTREIAEVIGARLELPAVSLQAEEAAGHFGFMGLFFSLDCPASSALTREQLGWRPKHPGLLADLDRPAYFAA
ncbi:MAG TPA: SDR family oxidoreductase [Caulobacteraceae bacterium]|nr:SDR family oxidoreductase [Caulobacteraceae bacterium]